MAAYVGYKRPPDAALAGDSQKGNPEELLAIFGSTPGFVVKTDG